MGNHETNWKKYGGNPPSQMTNSWKQHQDNMMRFTKGYYENTFEKSNSLFTKSNVQLSFCFMTSTWTKTEHSQLNQPICQ